MMKIFKNPTKVELDQILNRPIRDFASVDKVVWDVLDEVEKNGDSAIRAFSKRFDNVVLRDLLVTPEDRKVDDNVPIELKNAIQVACDNIYKFHKAQQQDFVKVETMEGVKCWKKSTPIEKVGLYIPGGSAPLFSTLLMLGIPAKTAGCEEVIVCTPPDENGDINPVILYVANLLGISKVFKVGGAQAIAAMGYGTESIPKVDKIFGPGNSFVTRAKMLLSAEGIAIDMPAGPSELAIIADKTATPDFIAADLLSQAEHGVDSQVLLVSDNDVLIRDVMSCLTGLIDILPRKAIVAEALKNSSSILVDSLDSGVDVINKYAPEHLIVTTKNPHFLVDKIKHAGSVFIGDYSPESVGDYASGTNHTLPTSSYARSYSGLTLSSFCKTITYQELTVGGLLNIADTVSCMAKAEGLDAHALAVTIRKNKLNETVV